MTRKVDRRQALATFGTVSLGGLLAACGGDDGGGTTGGSTASGETADATTKTPTSGSLAQRFDDASSCELAVEQTEGPYYFDVDSIRSDIREDREGTRLALALRVRDAGTCEPIENAVVDIWHCDAAGTYSGFEAASQGGPPGGGGGPSDDETYLRGAQATNSDGIARFTTIYPGWYQGRTVHIHAKVHLDKQTLLTTQLYFPDAFSDEVYTAEPYAGDGERDSSNDTDGIYDESLTLTLSPGGRRRARADDVRRAARLSAPVTAQRR